MSAKDKATGKEQSIRIQASGGLSEADIKQMVRDAEAHSEEDKKFEELATLRNQADHLIHSTKKTLSEQGDKVPSADRAKIEAAVSDLDGVLKAGEKPTIEAKLKALNEATATLAQTMYADAAAAQGADGAADGGGNAAGGAADGAVDAEFEEVKDDRKK